MTMEICALNDDKNGVDDKAVGGDKMIYRKLSYGDYYGKWTNKERVWCCVSVGGPYTTYWLVSGRDVWL